MRHPDDDRHRLEGETSPAAATPLANHEDDLSAAAWLRQTSASDGGQRVGNSGPVANPETSFPGEIEEHDRL